MTVDADKQARLEALRKALERGTYKVEPAVIVDAIFARAMRRLRAGQLSARQVL